MDPTVVSHPHPAGERPAMLDGNSDADDNHITPDPDPEANGDGDRARPAALKEDKQPKRGYARKHARTHRVGS